MSTITRLYSYTNGSVANADNITAEFNQLIGAVNTLDGKISRIGLDSTDTPAYLEDKIKAGTNITVTEVDDAGVRKLEITASGTVSTDHSLATNRDLADAHPMSAITGLVDAIAAAGEPADYSIDALKLADNAVVARVIATGAVGVDEINSAARTDSTSMTSSTVMASATAVKAAYDRGSAAYSLASGKENALNVDQKRKITVSYSDPSGGSDGEIWIKVV